MSITFFADSVVLPIATSRNLTPLPSHIATMCFAYSGPVFVVRVLTTRILAEASLARICGHRVYSLLKSHVRE